MARYEPICRLNSLPLNDLLEVDPRFNPEGYEGIEYQ